MAKIYLTGDYSEDGGTYALQIIADLLISKGHKVTFPAQYRVSCTQKEEESNTSWASKAFINNLHTITNSNCVLAIYSGLISNSNIGYELGYAAANNILTVIAHVNAENIAGVMLASGCNYNVRFSDIKKIDFDKLIADKAPSHQAINAWIVTKIKYLGSVLRCKTESAVWMWQALV